MGNFCLKASNNDLFFVKTSQGELKEYYLETGRCEAIYLTVICHPMLAQLWAVSEWRWGGSFPHWGSKALWLLLVLLPSAGLAGQFHPMFVLPTTSTNAMKAKKCLLWSTLLTWLSAKLNLPLIHFFPSPWCLWQGKPSVSQPFYLLLGREMKQSYRIACSLMLWSSLNDLLLANLALFSLWMRQVQYLLKGWVPRVSLILDWLCKPFLPCYQLFRWKSLLGVEQCCGGTLLRPHLLRACIDLCLSL